MLKIINSLSPFFEDCYRSISVREYGKIIGVSAPTASKILKEFFKKEYLSKTSERKHLFFKPNINSEEFTDLCRLYWKYRLRELSREIQTNLIGANAILFGSLTKAEVTATSDVDIAIFAVEKKSINLDRFRKTLKREISLHWFKNIRDVKNENMRNNILNGVVLFGKVKY